MKYSPGARFRASVLTSILIITDSPGTKEGTSTLPMKISAVVNMASVER